MVKAVITGDIIHSTRMTHDQQIGLFKLMNDALKTWSVGYNMKTEMFRGDSFQCLVHNKENALRVALILKTYIRSLNPREIYDIHKRSNTPERRGVFFTRWMFDARMAVGVGDVDLETNTLSNSNGPAFHLSGQMLDELKNSRQHLIIISDDEYNREWLTESVLLDAIIAKTSSLQCEVLNLKLLGYTETQIANRLNIMQSAVNQRSVSGNWNAINTMVKRYEEIYNHE